MEVGRVAALSRFPVKSMQGEDLPAVDVDERGIAGDRAWGVYTDDGGIGSGKTTRRFRRIDGLLDWAAALDGGTVVTPPSGTALTAGDAAADEMLSTAFGQPLRLLRESTVPHHDESPVHLVTTASLRRVGELAGGPVDPRRLRANIVLEVPGDDFAEDAWTGRRLTLGPDVVLLLGPGMPRCVMVDARPGRQDADPKVLRLLADRHDLLLGLQAHVVRTGTVRVGDPAVLS